MQSVSDARLTSGRIIVGVKYCFRYNARNRQMRNDDGEPITLENMPRPHRRRREKKLMPIDEVNEKFPMLKYKTWVTSRAQEGLPTRGGVSAPPSRPSSIRHADGVVPELPSKEHSTTDDQPTTSATVTGSGAQFAADAAPENPEKSAVKIPQHAPKESTSSTVGGLARPSMDSNHEPETTVVQKHMSQLSHDDEDDEHIDAALPPECVGTSGDTCAICIDTLEDDDDVRGLTCGHAFHAACIDPWLTTRRACCPLCKADYYTPKPRPQERVTEGADGTTGVIAVTLPGDNTRGHSRMNLPSRPRHAFLGFGRFDRRPTSARRRTGNGSRTAEDANSPGLAPSRSRTTSDSAPSPRSAPGSTGAGGRLFSGLRNAFPAFRIGTSRNDHEQSDATASGAIPADTTPSQLEAGTRNSRS
ncbi:uncharacterized protein THITE_2122103 [Thermothielavioides terrestris NRRL 8126]|uniref:RING-type domain-containing protein n=1 Tax=Thermothielavioides terrestris (strain ATCC 38088 / NRRL 8126) TaxID=578455 RepID=G2RC87_THETT|nr:uncharacterized protein THITE_2122103 [Thermothielavioides terrestris NRRL 8126]AEO70522.1 hypothetical protein THITE_2122103 [Thermothielavioides terrestris NRRL 8126]